MNTAEVLRKARALIEMPENWTQGAFGRNADRRAIEWGERANAYCAAGAVGAAAGGNHSLQCDQAWEILRSLGGQRSVAEWNDAPERTHAEVLAAFDKAIAIAEGGTP